jgi:protein-L-isoaspartate(D-aspartate) O-methyltransferase
MTIHPTSNLDEMAREYAQRLVATLKHGGKLTSPLLEEAFNSIPRHIFIDQFYRRDGTTNSLFNYQLIQAPPQQDAASWLEAVYADDALITAISEVGIPTSSSSAPDVMTLMLEALDVHAGLRVLEIGTGTGYNAALLAHIVGDPHLVFSVEIDPGLAQQAQQRIDRVVGSGAAVHTGNGLEGYAQAAPFDRIIATGRCRGIPHSWLEQLSEGGILVMNLEGNLGAGSLLQIQKVSTKGAAHGRFLGYSSFMELRASIEVPPPAIPGRLFGFSGRPVIAKISLSQATFDPALLWETDFAFLLQLEFPCAYISSIQKQASDPPTLCLIDEQSQTMVMFCPPEQDSDRVIEIKGEPQTWEKLYRAYQYWIDLERPTISDYVIDIDESGKQSVTLTPSRAGAHPPTWILKA